VIVPDSSAWIEVFRATGSPIDRTLTRLLTDRMPIATTEMIVCEVLAGARSTRNPNELRAQLLGFEVFTLEGMADYEAAAELYRMCRVSGETIREIRDCLIAIPVIRAGAELLHNDADFEAIARHSDLRIYRGNNN